MHVASRVTALLAVAALVACSGSGESGDARSTSTATASTSIAVATTPEPTATSAEPTTTVAPTTTEAPPTTQDPTARALAYSEPGPYPVGVTTLALPSGPSVEVWYPAAEPATGTVGYDVRDFTPDAVKALLTADLPARFDYPATRDAAVVDENAFPLAIYSHGFSGINVGSSFLTSHLASWGVVVAAPEHPSRDLAAATSFQLNMDPQASIDDVLGTIELMRTPGPLLDGRIDLDSITLIGHSAGGGTVLNAAIQSDDVDAYVSLASGALGRRDDQSSTTAAPPAPPSKPSMFIAGREDKVVPWDTITQAAFDSAPRPSLLWVIDSVGHNGFDDFCTFGNGTGIIGIAEASGLAAFLDANASFRSLGEDGCKPPNVPVTEVWPIIRHGVTAFVLANSGTPDAETTLDPALAVAYVPTVTATAKG